MFSFQRVHYLLSYLHFTTSAMKLSLTCDNNNKKINGWLTHLPMMQVRVLLGYESLNPYHNPSKTHQFTPGFSIPVPFPTPHQATTFSTSSRGLPIYCLSSSWGSETERSASWWNWTAAYIQLEPYCPFEGWVANEKKVVKLRRVGQYPESLDIRTCRCNGYGGLVWQWHMIWIKLMNVQ